MESHTSCIQSIAFSHDGCLLASASGDDTIKIWDVSTGTCLQTLLGSNSWIVEVAFSTTSYQLASSDDRINIWDVNDGVLVRTLAGHDGPVSHLVYGINDSFLASGPWDGTIKLFDALSGVCIRTIVIGRKSAGFSIAFTHNDQILSCRIRNFLLIWDLKVQNDPYRIQLRDLFSGDLVSSQTNELFLIQDDQIEIWDPATKVRVRTIKYPLSDSLSHGSHEYSIILSKHGTLLGVTGSYWFKVFNHSTLSWGKEIRKQRQDISVSPTNDILALASGPTVKLWDLSVLPHWEHLSEEANYLLGFSNNGSSIVTRSITGNKPRISRSCTGSPIFMSTVDEKDPILSPDSQVLLMRSDGINIHVKHMSQESAYEDIGMISLPDHSYRSLAVSHDNRWLAVSFRNGSVNIWGVAAKQFSSPIATITMNAEHADAIETADDGTEEYEDLAVSFSHDSLSLAVYNGKHIKLYESNTWRCKSTIYTYEGNNVSPHNVVFSYDDRFLAINPYDFITRETKLSFWNLETMVCVRLKVPGKRFSILGLDTTAVWRLETCSCTYEIIDRAIHPVRPKYEVSEDLQWLCQGPERLLWLPPEFRPGSQHNAKIKFCKSCSKFKVAIVTSAHRIVILTLP
ncbi:hypothetical protein FPOAC1_007697 [Fusarium poae]|uniref:hypothetical protein n=1 Tax=Fusarium poae TaxID=36050 RepID=UPI001CE8B091|nr:hypothetical protein FPOAC1_007697 [Fusarium poae]KAG8668318.1 hypothetical protein FPOAC1_007697 [Fusarium poae]